ncbi:hypothetical protein [Pyrolobus fumarii]|uniref:hypothetical protein n=1 Tax=Pyrolobus fumarii TaxID=54252 RepID=UPI001433001E|nr:hypothetical protein [Pyrolobus fumarii]
MSKPLWLDEEKLVKLVRRARERWPDFEVLRIEQRMSKQVLIVQVQGYRLKLIIYRDGRVRCYGPLEGATLALKRMAMRVIGVDEQVESGEESSGSPVGRAAPHKSVRRRR